LYLSRLILDKRSRRVQRELAKPYEMHRSIMGAFPDLLQKGQDRVLWRVDEDPEHGLVLVVQSRLKPDWSWASEDETQRYVAQPKASPVTQVSALRLRLAAGQMLGFRLRANPTKKRRFRKSGDHKRVGIEIESDQLDWLRRKGESAGFEILTVQVTPEDTVEGVIRRDSARHRLNLVALRFDGSLRVTDPVLLRKAVARGIGSGKGFGFGLFSLTAEA
jgi:CRISPR system Cascade subunit CasE